MNRSWAERLASIAGFLGIVSILAAVGFFIIELQLTGTSGFLLVWGAALILVWIILNPDPFLDMFRGKGLRYGTLNVVMSALLLGILVVLNVFVSQHPEARADLTRLKVHTLDDRTKSLLKTVKKPIYVVAFLPNGGAGGSTTGVQPVTDILAEFQAQNHNVVLRQVFDPDKSPSADQIFNVTPGSSTIFFLTDCRDQISPASCKTESVTGTTEADLDSGLLKLVQGGARKVCFVGGHGEPEIAPIPGAASGGGAGEYAQVGPYLQAQNFQLGGILLAGDIPKDCSVVVEMAPRHPLADNEIAALDSFLKSGGHLMVLADGLQTQNLNQLVTNYGISLDTGILYETDQRKRYIPSDPTVVALITQGKHKIVADLPNFLFVSAAATSINAEAKSSEFTVTKLIASFDTSYEAAASRTDYGSVQSDDHKGPFTVAAAVESTKAVNGQHYRLVVAGTARFMADSFTQRIQGNQSLIVPALNWLSEREVSVAIPTAAQQTDSLSSNPGDQRKLLFLLALILPGVILLFGLSVWYSRR